MTSNDFIQLLKRPQAANTAEIQQLKELIDAFPYFTPARMLYLRGLKQTNSLYFEHTLQQVALQVPDRRRLYYYIYPEQKSEQKKYRRAEKHTGDYFGMLEAVEQEGKDIGQSLKLLAERLRKARLDIVSEQNKQQTAKKLDKQELFEKKNKVSDDDLLILHNVTIENYPEKLKILMQEQNHELAYRILTQLNLNNPKKSRYFADQIRFLEKVIEIKNK